MSSPFLRIATRKSALALWQAEHVAARLKALAPRQPLVLVPLITQGDRNLQDSLALVGGKGLFVKELETALAEDRADLAVHSMKDVPAELHADLSSPRCWSGKYPGMPLFPIAGRRSSSCPQGRAWVARAYAVSANCCTFVRT